MFAVRIALATEEDRDCIYRMRHAIYAEELGQHAANSKHRLTDSLDAFNLYFVATAGGFSATSAACCSPSPTCCIATPASCIRPPTRCRGRVTC